MVDEALGRTLLKNYKTECRVCGGGLNHYLSLGLSPLANNLNNSKNANNELYPLDLNFCKDCYNSQLSIAVPPKKMFNNYLYSSTSNTKNHFILTSKEIKKELIERKISCGYRKYDGIFIEPLQKFGIAAIGYWKNIAKIANSKGLTTYSEYFDKRTVEK